MIPECNAWEVLCLHSFFFIPGLLSLVKPEHWMGFPKKTWKHPKNIKKWWIHPLLTVKGILLPYITTAFYQTHNGSFEAAQLLRFLWPGGHVVGLVAKQRSHAPSARPPLLVAWPGFGDGITMSFRANNSTVSTVSTGSQVAFVSKVAWIKVAWLYQLYHWNPAAQTTLWWPQRLPHEAVAVPHILGSLYFDSSEHLWPFFQPTIPVSPFFPPNFGLKEFNFDVPFSTWHPSPQTDIFFPTSLLVQLTPCWSFAAWCRSALCGFGLMTTCSFQGFEVMLSGIHLTKSWRFFSQTQQLPFHFVNLYAEIMVSKRKRKILSENDDKQQKSSNINKNLRVPVRPLQLPVDWLIG